MWSGGILKWFPFKSARSQAGVPLNFFFKPSSVNDGSAEVEQGENAEKSSPPALHLHFVMDWYSYYQLLLHSNKSLKCFITIIWQKRNLGASYPGLFSNLSIQSHSDFLPNAPSTINNMAIIGKMNIKEAFRTTGLIIAKITKDIKAIMPPISSHFQASPSPNRHAPVTDNCNISLVVIGFEDSEPKFSPRNINMKNTIKRPLNPLRIHRKTLFGFLLMIFSPLIFLTRMAFQFRPVFSVGSGLHSIFYILIIKSFSCSFNFDLFVQFSILAHNGWYMLSGRISERVHVRQD